MVIDIGGGTTDLTLIEVDVALASSITQEEVFDPTALSDDHDGHPSSEWLGYMEGSPRGAVVLLACADDDVVCHLAAAGFRGPDYEAFEARLARRGFQTIWLWVRSGLIFVRCAEKRIKGLPRPGPNEVWSDEDVEELVQDTIARALVLFRRKALLEGGWRPDGGASLMTYFIGTCLFAFAEVYRRHRRSWLRRAQADALAVQDRAAVDVPDVAETVAERRIVAEVLANISDPRLRIVVALTVDGYTHAEIAAALADGTSARAVEGMLYRYRKQVTRGWEVTDDDR